MTGEPDVIRLLHLADWTRLSLAAEVNDGSRLVLAPGKRYRQEGPDGVSGCDGSRPWRPRTAEDADVHWVSGPGAPLPMLLCPAWLLRSSRLEVRGHVTACGRDALHVVASERASIRDKGRMTPLRAGRTEALVDAELGILLRVAWLPDEPAAGAPPDVTELISLDVDPVIDPAQFAPPPGSFVAASFGETAGPLAAALKTAAGLAAGGLGAWIKYWPFGRAPTGTEPEDPEAAMPLDDPVPEVAPDGRLPGPDVSDEVLRLLHASGTAAFAGTLHQWYDVAAMLSQVPETARRTGLGGLGMLVSALTERATTAAHMASSLRVGGPGRYQIHRLFELRHGPKTIACDGHRRWQVYPDKIAVGPAKPPPADIGDLADASWLLECRLAGGALIMAGDRPAYRIDVTRGGAPWSFLMMFSPAVAIVDAELGILLTLTSYLGAKPVLRYELRDVSAVPAGGFGVDIPAGLPTEPETDRWDEVRHADPSHPGRIPLKVAGVVAREVGQQATRAARNFMRRLGAP
jgi:hypothetical protein